MQIFEMDTNDNLYKMTKEITVKCGSTVCECLFPQQYLKSKCFLVNKNGKNVNLLKKKENDDFVVEQSIEFSSPNCYGQLSDDGEYLITWDNEQKEIQIRKFKQF
ncbi:unnamed protein product [Paramecium pentaurelia]|uniref:Uncharacterized protein n=1 Tax=Paramecium pentaurelia TaxID=43138 RepID=A0A8S1XMJ3_9CILI|nr:unnamed protein product [Paramecium pentaurelia]